MSIYHAKAVAIIPAPADDIYTVIADFKVEHPAILPKQFFKSVTVLEGGTGAGTVYEAKMNVYGAKRTFVMSVSEPEPGRKLVETATDGNVITAFILEPLENNQCRVTISTQAKTAPGLRGFMEKLFNPGIMGRIYKKELKQLADYMQTRSVSQAV